MKVSIMAITIEWDTVGFQTLVCTFEGSWDWQEAGTALDQLKVMAESVEKANLIVLRQNTRIRRDEIVQNLLDLLRNLPSNLDLIVIIGASAFAQTMIEALKGVGMVKNILFAQTLEEARVLLKQHEG